MKHKTRDKYIEIALGFLFLMNVVLLLYFINKLNQIESLAKQTEARAQEIIQTLHESQLNQ